MQNVTRHGLWLALCALGLSACGGGGGGSDPGSDSGTLSLSVTDAPVDNAARVLVQFSGVTVHQADGAPVEFGLEGDSQTCQDLLDGIAPAPAPAGEPTVRCVEMLELQGTDSEGLLDDVELEAGEYNALRLHVDAARGVMDSLVVLDDGSVESLFIPSGGESGLKLNSDFTILAGGGHDFVVDFDLRKSLNNPQGFPDYRLRPSLRLVDLAKSGNITGTVDASLLTAAGCTGDVNTGAGFAVYLYTGDDGSPMGEEGSADAPLTSAAVALDDDSGQWMYTVGYVSPGEYRVGFTCQALDDSPEAPDDGIEILPSGDNPVTVVADEDAVADFP